MADLKVNTALARPRLGEMPSRQSIYRYITGPAYADSVLVSEWDRGDRLVAVDKAGQLCEAYCTVFRIGKLTAFSVTPKGNVETYGVRARIAQDIAALRDLGLRGN